MAISEGSSGTDLASGDLQVVARVAAILEMFSTSRSAVRTAEVAAHLGLGRSTVHRYLASLENHHFIKRVDGGSYELGSLAVRLGAMALAQLRLVESAGPVLERLSEQVHQTTVLSVWGGRSPVVARVHENWERVVQVGVRVGSLLPLDTAQAATFLAHLDDRQLARQLLGTLPPHRRSSVERVMTAARKDGVAIQYVVDEGIRALACPVFDAEGSIAGAMAIVGTSALVPAGADSGAALLLRQAAVRLSQVAFGVPENPASSDL